MAKVVRLLDQFIPEKYVLHLDVDMKALTSRGMEQISFTLTAASRELVLHGVGLEVTLGMLDQTKMATSISLNPEDGTVILAFDEEITAGGHELNLSFNGVISDSLHGFYRSDFLDGDAKKILATTQFEAIHAREAFVCVDEPSAKAIFEISLTVPDQMTAVSNTNAVTEAPAEAGMKKVSFAPTPKMSKYLIAFIVGELEHVEATAKGDISVRVYATPGKTGQLGFALDAAVRTLDYFNDYFGIPYPLSKLDLVTVPDFSAGAMENWGVITFRDTALMVDPSKTSLANRQRVAEVVAHELAHQWFGNLVTMSWWDDLWLNEGFATWVASLAMDKLWPEWNIWTQFIQEEYDQALSMDSLANTHPIQVEVDDPKGLDEIFDAISYAKGASILNMIHHYLGPDDFKRGLHEYLKKHAYGNSVTTDLWESLEKASGKPVTHIMPTWTRREGYPIVSFEEGQARQQRFYSSPKEAAKADRLRMKPWPIPFSAVTGEHESQPIIMEKTTMDLPPDVMRAGWFKPNPGQTSFYRTHYSAGMVEALTGPMQSGRLSATDRFGMVSDVFATTEAGISDTLVALQLLSAMREETDYVVWGSLSGGLGSVIGVVEDETMRNQLDEFGRWLVDVNVKRLGWEAAGEEDSFSTLMRPVVLHQAVRFGNPAVTKEAKRRFDHYMQGGDIDPNLRPVILYAAARHGGADEYATIQQRYLTEESPQAKISLLGALGHFRKRALVEEYLKFGLGPDVRPQDIYIIIAWAFRNRDGRDLAWQWMQDNWPEFLRRYGQGGHMLERFPLYASSGFATHKMATEIGAFFASHPHPSIKRPTAQAVESVELKADWFDRDRPKIAAFLNDWKLKQNK